MSVDDQEPQPDPGFIELPGIGEHLPPDESIGEPVGDPEGPIADAPVEAPAPPAEAEPVAPAERVGSVDVLRGVALLGILAMNINGFGWPEAVYENPVARPGAGAVDIVLWAFNHLVFDTKMMTLFSMLFGAGLVLMDSRAEARGAKIRGVYYRRTFWLLMIGLAHSYLVWDGDILVMYASCGFFLYLFRRKTPRTLIILGTLLVMTAVPLLFVGRGFYRYAQRTAPEVEAKLRLDIPQTEFRMFVANKWAKAKSNPGEAARKFREDIELHRGGYGGILYHRAKNLIWMQTFGFLLFGFWLAGGRMLIGMGLMKLGVFTAERSWKFYAWMTALGYGVGLPLIAFDTYELIQYQWSFLNYGIEGGFLLNMVCGVIVVMGHIGLVMMICKAGLLPGLTRRLGAAGRMALSNYLFDSLLCTTLFYGYGFGLFGKLDRAQLYGVVIAIWAFQLWFSPIWLARFRYGPAEWLWRSLTYWKLQPMRRPVPVAVEEVAPAPAGEPTPALS